MVLFAHADHAPPMAGPLSHWRPMRCAAVVASLALSLAVVASSGVLDFGLTAAAAPDAGGPATTTKTSVCPPAPADGQPILATQLAQLYTTRTGPTTLGPASAPGSSSTCAPRLAIPLPTSGVPTHPGQVILVSRSQQWLWAYQDGRLVFATPVTTGQPALPTPLGTYHVMSMASNTTFYSPWPKGSPYYYDPLHIDYALLFRAGGFYIHDAPWRYAFGTGTNLDYSLPDGSAQTGSHGCVDVPIGAGAWLYSWAGTATQIVIVDDAKTRVSPPSEHRAA